MRCRLHVIWLCQNWIQTVSGTASNDKRFSTWQTTDAAKDSCRTSNTVLPTFTTIKDMGTYPPVRKSKTFCLVHYICADKEMHAVCTKCTALCYISSVNVSEYFKMSELYRTIWRKIVSKQKWIKWMNKQTTSLLRRFLSPSNYSLSCSEIHFKTTELHKCNNSNIYFSHSLYLIITINKRPNTSMHLFHLTMTLN